MFIIGQHQHWTLLINIDYISNFYFAHYPFKTVMDQHFFATDDTQIKSQTLGH